MIDDTIVDAMDALIGMCSNLHQQLGMWSMREMLCELNPDEFACMNDKEREVWLEQFLSCLKKK